MRNQPHDHMRNGNEKRYVLGDQNDPRYYINAMDPHAARSAPSPEDSPFPSPRLGPYGKRVPSPPLTPMSQPADPGSTGPLLSGARAVTPKSSDSDSATYQSGDEYDVDDHDSLFDDTDIDTVSFTHYYGEDIEDIRAASADEMETPRRYEDESKGPAFVMVDGRIEFSRHGDEAESEEEDASADEMETSWDDEDETNASIFSMDDDRIELSGYGAGDALQETGLEDAFAPSTGLAQAAQQREPGEAMTGLNSGISPLRSTLYSEAAREGRRRRRRLEAYNQPGPSIVQSGPSGSQAGLSNVQSGTIGSTTSRLSPTPDLTDEPSNSSPRSADGGIEALLSNCDVNSACAPKFERFLQLPAELRERIYSLALSTEAPIRPHLCDESPSGSIKFHDAAKHSRRKSNHDSINKLLGITLVSKAVRSASFPFFYSSNTFAVGADTPTYFTHLQNLGRFHLIRNVQFKIHMNGEIWTAQFLEQLTTYLKAAEGYESAHSANRKDTYKALINHPRYNVSGLSEMALMICARMLTSTFPSTTTSPTFVLPIPRADIFSTYAGLRWFPEVCHVLDINLRFLEGHELEYNEQGVIGVTWQQKYQKKDFGIEEGEKGGAEVAARALEMFPDLKERIRWKRCVYYRVSCDGQRMRWFEVKT